MMQHFNRCALIKKALENITHAMGSRHNRRFEVRWINGEEIDLHNRGYCQRIHENMDITWVISAIADVGDWPVNYLSLVIGATLNTSTA